MPKALAVDYGEKRCGLAITDDLMMIGSPLETVETTKALDRIAELITREKITVVIIGEARHLDGNPSEITLRQETFATKLAKKIPGVQIERLDEMFTSKMAARAMAEGGMKKKERQKKENLDMISAAILLQEWLRIRKP